MMIPLLLAAAAAAAAPANPAHPCANDARDRALKLLRFHADGDNRATIDPASLRKIGTVPSLVGNRRFDVLEIWGSVYKGEYRMRLIYANPAGMCVLMGEEILEHSDPY